MTVVCGATPWVLSVTSVGNVIRVEPDEKCSSGDGLAPYSLISQLSLIKVAWRRVIMKASFWPDSLHIRWGSRIHSLLKSKKFAL